MARMSSPSPRCCYHCPSHARREKDGETAERAKRYDGRRDLVVLVHTARKPVTHTHIQSETEKCNQRAEWKERGSGVIVMFGADVIVGSVLALDRGEERTASNSH